jgi:alpha-galactosidase
MGESMPVSNSANLNTVVAGTLSLAWDDGDDLHLASLRAGGREWLAGPSTPFGDGASVRNAGFAREGNVTRLTGALDPAGLTIDATWTAWPDHSVLVADYEVRNDTDASLELGSLPSLTLAMDRNGGDQLALLNGGRWDEAMPPPAYRLDTRELDEFRQLTIGAAGDGRSTAEHVPWLVLTDPSGGGMIASLAWSGRWRLDAHRSGDTIVISIGIADFAHTLAPGECISLPGLVLHGFDGNLDDAANTWRDWVTHHWMPATPENWPWVQYNHWYAYAGDIDEDRLYGEAVYAAAAGAEVFVIDDGWFMGRLATSYVRGWGDWREDPAKFPSGLKAFGDRIRGLGMKFGLWVEPERADDTGALVAAHPEWVARRDGAFIYRPNDGNHEADGALQGVHLCLGNPDVQRWMADDIVRVVREYGVDWLKWDYNLGYGLGCNDPNHGHQAGDGHHAHTLGLYTVFGAIREACPDLVIENCASGGHRMDLGTLRHSHTNWVSDYTHRAASCRQHAQGAGLFLPLAHVNTWVLDKRDRYEFRSRMGGGFGFSDFMGKWSAAEREDLAAAVGEYKALRPFLHGRRYLLTGPLHQDWDIWQFVHPDGNRIALLAFRENGRIDEVRVGLREIDPERRYQVTDADTGGTVPMANDSLAIALTPRTSALLWVDVVS